jgi:hypothetical protein
MADKQDLGEVVAYGLTGIAFVLAFPVVGPVVMYRDWNDYATKYSWVPGIREAGGTTSAMSAFVYVLLGAALIGGAAVGASNGFAAYGPTIAESAGIGGVGDSGSAATPTPAETETPADEMITVETDTETPTDSAALEAERQQYRQFGQELAGDARANETVLGAEVVAVDAERDRVTIEYQTVDMGDTDTRRAAQRTFLTLWAATVENVTTDESEYGLDEIPESVELVGTVDGEVHHSGEMLFSAAYKYVVGDISQQEYERRFFSNTEGGPAQDDE